MKSTFTNEGIPRVKFSMRDMSVSQYSAAKRIENIDCLSQPLDWWFDEKTFMSEITVEYNKRHKRGVYEVFTDNALEQEAYENTPVITEYRYQSSCTELSDIITLAEERYERGIIAPYRIKGKLGKDLEFNLLDVVRYHHKRYETQIINDALWLVSGIDHVNRSFELSLIHEDSPADVVEFSGDLYGLFTMYNDNQYANLQGEDL
jgi:hypothetical protein